MKKVLGNALPAGMLVVTSIVFAITLGFVTETSLVHIKGVCAYSLAIGSFINLINVCRPMNRYRAVVVGVLIGIFGLIIVFASEFFEFNLLNAKLWIYMILHTSLLIVLFSVYKKLIKTILK